MCLFIQLVGLPASGKSEYAKQLAQKYDATIFSSDKLREKMFGDINDQYHNAEVFQELHRQIKIHLKSGRNAIMDSTSTSSKQRKNFIRELGKIECYKHCIVLATPYEQCLENNANRERKVPVRAIERKYLNWSTPAMFEGWDAIDIGYWAGSENSKSIASFICSNLDTSQHNPHHSMTIGEHCLAVGQSLANESNDVWAAGCLHDCGKPYAMTFKNAKGEKSDVAHFYNHENCGAYDALFFDYCENDVNPLDVSLLVNLHMRPYVFEQQGNDRLRNKCKKLWGDDLFAKVMKIYEADRAAH